MKKCRIIGCQSNGLRNSKSCFEHVKNPPRPARGMAQVNTTGASSYADTSGSITFTSGTSATTTTGGHFIFSGTTSTWTTV